MAAEVTVTIWERLATSTPINRMAAKGQVMTKNVLASIEADAARFGFTKRHLHEYGGRKTAWVIKCSKCVAEFRAYWPPNTSPALMVKNMRVRHWDVAQGERPLCPTCAHKKDRGPEPKPATQFEVHVQELPKTKTAEALIDAAVKKFGGVENTYEKVKDGVIKEWVELVMPAPLFPRSAPPPNIPIPAPSTSTMLLAGAEKASRLILGLGALDDLKARKEEKVQRLKEAEANLLAAKQARAANARAAKLRKVEARREEIRRAAEEVARNRYVEPKPPPKISIPSLEIRMTDGKSPTPSPKITHIVFQQLDAVFSPDKRLYNHGWTDQRVAKECGTSEEVVAYLRTETFGQLAEDPRISALRDDLALMAMEAEKVRKDWEAQLHELRSRVEQMAAHFQGR